MATDQVPAPDTERKTAEERPAPAEQVGPPAPDVHGRMTVEAWAAKKETAPWKFKAVAAGKVWPIGLELTEQAYDEAIAWLDSNECVSR